MTMIRLILIFSLICTSMFAQMALIVNTETGEEVIKKFPSRTDTVIGLSPNLEIYIVLRKDRPSYDYLTERLVSVKRFTDSISGYKYPFVVYEWQKQRLDDETIIARKEIAVLQKEMELLINQIPENEFRQYVVMGLAALIYETRGGTLNADHNEILDIIFNRGLKTFQNRENKKQLLQDLQIDPDTDINLNWVE